MNVAADLKCECGRTFGTVFKDGMHMVAAGDVLELLECVLAVADFGAAEELRGEVADTIAHLAAEVKA